MKISLVYVGIGVAGFNANRPPGDREGSWIGHGVASVGASLRQAGHQVDLIDLRQLGGWGDLASTISQTPAEVYGLSISPVDHYSALKTIHTIKTVQPQARIIVGGLHPTMFPQEYTCFRVVDSVVKGEGEVTMPKLVRMLEEGKQLPKEVQGERPELDKIPWVARGLFQYNRELTCNFGPDQPLPSITMLAGRGCPYKCAYCQPAENAVFGTPYRIRPPRGVANEMLFLKQQIDYKSVVFWDDTFTVDPKWVDKFVQIFKQTPFPVSIAACSRVDIICNNDAMIGKLKEIGLDWLVIGLESGSQRLLDLIRKGTTVEQNFRAAEICRKHGVKIFATYMLGLPTETEEESLATETMIDRIAPEHRSPFWYVPIPGTHLYNFCEKSDLLLRKDQSIERTGRFEPMLRGVNYEFLQQLREGCRYVPNHALSA